MKLNDLHKILPKEIDIKHIYTKKDIYVFPVLKYNNKTKSYNLKNTLDVRNWLEEIKLKWNSKIKIHKSNTYNFDSVYFLKENKPINLKINQIIDKNLKHAINLSGNDTKIKSNNISNLKQRTKKINYKMIIFIIISITIIDLFISIRMVSKWYYNLSSIKSWVSNIEGVKKKINDSKFDFIVWWALFKPFSFLNFEITNNTYNIIQWWKELANLWDDSIKIYFKIKDLINKKWANNLMLSNLFFNLKDDIININIWLNNAYNHFDKVTILWYKDKKEQIDIQKKNLKQAIYYTKVINDNFDTILNILWHNNEKKYLVVFQNADEIRPTWWFMWSMWVLTFGKWKILSFEKNDIYAHEWELKSTDIKKEPAPKWINQITKTFWLRDSNYFIDIWQSSEKIKYFIENIWYKVDWIIYLNQNTILDFLEKNWQIDSVKIWEIISDKNFSEIMSILVEAKIFKVWTLWTPKQILFDFIEEFTEKLKSKWDYLTYIKIISNNIIKRNIIFYSFDKKDNKLLENLWINWKINYNKTIDFNYPVFTSISWNKSDRYMERKFEKTVKINKDCNIESTFNIKSNHNLTKEKENELNILINNYNIKEKENALNIQWLWDNNQFLRLVLPKNAIIEKTDTIEIIEWENTKIVEWFIKTKRFETNNFTIKYYIPNKDCNIKYNYNFYKQAWLKNYDFIFEKDDIKIERKSLDIDFNYKD